MTAAYLRLARLEERRVEEEFGERYADYAQTVPSFIPGLKKRTFYSPGGTL